MVENSTFLHILEETLYNLNMEKEFVEILTEFLKEQDINQKQFAEKIGVKPSQVSEWLKGKAKPNYDTLKKIARSYNISADYFLGLTDTY